MSGVLLLFLKMMQEAEDYRKIDHIVFKCVKIYQHGYVETI